MRLTPFRPASNISTAVLDSSVRAVILLVAVALVGWVVMTVRLPLRDVDAHLREGTGPVPDPVQALIELHRCWRSDEQAPPDLRTKFPSHAIVDGRYVGQRLTALAFDQEIGGHPHGLAVSAFCR